MFRLIWIASIHTRYFLRRHMPTNVALDAIRTRHGLKWGVPTMLVAIPYLYVASILTVMVKDGRAGLAAPVRAAVHLECDEVRDPGTGQRRPAGPGPRPNGASGALLTAASKPSSDPASRATSEAVPCTFSVTSDREGGPLMAAVADLARDERTARMVLSMLAEPNDGVTGRILSHIGAVETLRLVDDDGAVPGLNPDPPLMFR